MSETEDKLKIEHIAPIHSVVLRDDDGTIEWNIDQFGYCKAEVDWDACDIHISDLRALIAKWEAIYGDSEGV